MKVRVLDIRCEAGCEEKRRPLHYGKEAIFPIEAEEWEVRTSRTCQEGHRLLFALEPIK